MNERYELRDPRRALPGVFSSIVTLAIVGAVAVGTGRVTTAIIFGVVLLLVAAWQARRAMTVLRADRSGILLTYPSIATGRPWAVEQRLTPWTSVESVSANPAGPSVRVTLRGDAPMPRWLRTRVTAPGDAGPSIDQDTPQLDPSALGQVVRTVAPEVRYEVSTL